MKIKRIKAHTRNGKLVKGYVARTPVRKAMEIVKNSILSYDPYAGFDFQGGVDKKSLISFVKEKKLYNKSEKQIKKIVGHTIAKNP